MPRVRRAGLLVALCLAASLLVGALTAAHDAEAQADDTCHESAGHECLARGRRDEGHDAAALIQKQMGQVRLKTQANSVQEVDHSRALVPAAHKDEASLQPIPLLIPAVLTVAGAGGIVAASYAAGAAHGAAQIAQPHITAIVQAGKDAVSVAPQMADLTKNLMALSAAAVAAAKWAVVGVLGVAVVTSLFDAAFKAGASDDAGFSAAVGQFGMPLTVTIMNTLPHSVAIQSFKVHKGNIHQAPPLGTTLLAGDEVVFRAYTWSGTDIELDATLDINDCVGTSISVAAARYRVGNPFTGCEKMRGFAVLGKDPSKAHDRLCRIEEGMAMDGAYRFAMLLSELEAVRGGKQDGPNCKKAEVPAALLRELDIDTGLNINASGSCGRVANANIGWTGKENVTFVGQSAGWPACCSICRQQASNDPPCAAWVYIHDGHCYQKYDLGTHPVSMRYGSENSDAGIIAAHTK